MMRPLQTEEERARIQRDLSAALTREKQRLSGQPVKRRVLTAQQEQWRLYAESLIDQGKAIQLRRPLKAKALFNQAREILERIKAQS